MPPAPRERDDTVRVACVEEITRFEPTLASHEHSDADIVERIH